MSKLEALLIFVVGASLGSLLTWRWLKHSYQEQFDQYEDEVQNLRKALTKSLDNEISKSVQEMVQQEKKAQEPIRHSFGAGVDEPKKKVDLKGKIKVIDPNDFGSIEEYARISMTLWADGVLTDDTNDVIDDISDSIGEDALNSIGLYEEDSVHVRNDYRKAYYEVLKDCRTYEEYRQTIPRRINLT